MRGKRSYRTFIQWGVALAILVFLGKMVWENWSQVREASFAFRLLPFLLATFLFILSYFIQVWAWYVITLRLGIAIPIKETLVSWFYSQLGKYLPGKVWLLLTRFYFYHSKGKSKKAITVALYLETVTLVMAAGFIFLISLLFWREAEMVHFGISSQWLLRPFFLGRLNPPSQGSSKNDQSDSDALEERTDCHLDVLSRRSLDFRDLRPCLVGRGDRFLSSLLTPVFPVASKDFVFFDRALAISSTLGLIALFAPSGLGVREGVLVYLLSVLIPGLGGWLLAELEQRYGYGRERSARRFNERSAELRVSRAAI